MEQHDGFRQMQGKNGPFTPPRFSHIYHLKTIGEENSKGSWHGWEMSLEGPITDAALYTRAKGLLTASLLVMLLLNIRTTNSVGGDTPF
jgi:hypothetical protein